MTAAVGAGDAATATQVLGSVRRGGATVHPGLPVAGGWHRPGPDGPRIDCVDPTTEDLLGTVPDATPAEVDVTVRAAREASQEWRALGWRRRAALLHDLADAVLGRAEDIARLDVLDSGNPILGMRADVRSAADELRYYAGLAGMTHGTSIPTGSDITAFTRREPYGVVARIVPFNHPFKFACGKAAAGLAAGNAVVVKPGEQTSLSAIALAEIAQEVLPPAVLSVVTGTGAGAGTALVSHPAVQRVAFTGSVATGRRILAAAAANIAHATLELGGKNPLVVCPDVDPEWAAGRALRSMNIVRSNGQSCGSTSRLYVHERILAPFTQALTALVSALRVGDPLEEATDVGPLAFVQHRDRVLGHIRRAVEEGAVAATGGGRPSGLDRGWFVEPTVFTSVTDDMAIAQDEVFGPVISVLSWSSLDDVVRRANDSSLGLTAGVLTRDVGVAHLLADRLEAGFVTVNGTGRRPPGSPFGGWKQSGLGKENSPEELLSYTREKAIAFVRPDDLPSWT